MNARGVLCLLLLAAACQAPRGVLSPEALRAAPLQDTEKTAALAVWQEAIDLGNAFLASPHNRTLPADARLELGPAGMALRTPARTMPIPLVLIDDYMKSSCVCATVDTHRREVLVFRPWGTDPALPILTHNTFFIPVVTAGGEPRADIAFNVLRYAAIFHHDAASHISGWEWFKCQYLEWLIGSGHHEVSMRHANAVFHEFGRYWYEHRDAGR